MSEEYETTNQEPRNYDAVVYTPLDPEPAPDPEPFTSDRTGIESAADELKSTRAERNVIVERAFHDGVDTSKAAPGNRTLSPEYAAEKLQETRDWEKQLAQEELDAATAAAVDDFRSDQPPPTRIGTSATARASSASRSAPRRGNRA
jgi:hypothetical protein